MGARPQARRTLSGRLRAAGLLCVAAFAASASGCLGGGCGETRQSSNGSPDGRNVASVYVRDCGATTGFVTHVNLSRASESPRPERDD
ncbi:MAG TPA: hypothetical protein VER08_10680 [Pyrinomonadaceae bacterium]|nr:hypothetical protein [Pyrinomonadaceae bacterium]